jgi:hypothetical protein
MFNPQLKNCYVACSKDKINQGQCECLKQAMNESGPFKETEDFQYYLEVFCSETKTDKWEVYSNPALLETVVDIYKNIKQVQHG